MLVLDPRTDTITESNNAALIARHMAHGNMRQDRETELRWSELADVCDQPVDPDTGKPVYPAALSPFTRT